MRPKLRKLRKFQTIFLLAVVLLVGFQPYRALAVEKLVLNTGTRDPFTTDNHQGFLDLLIREVFQRLGIEAEVIVYEASARALASANSGIDDGATLRVKGIDKKFTNLVRVPEKLMDNDFVAYSVKDYSEIDSWESLAPFDIAYILGWQVFQNNLNDHKATIRVKDADQMMNLLALNRVDFILYERWQGLWRAKMRNMKIKVYDPPLAQKEMFMYLHRKHADLVERTAEVLREMKKDGTYQQIFDETLTPYLQ